MSRYRDARNPLDQLIEQESRTCKGCQHLEQAWGRQLCGIGMQKEKKELIKCKKYKERSQ